MQWPSNLKTDVALALRALDCAPFALAICDTKGRITYANKVFEKIFQYSIVLNPGFGINDFMVGSLSKLDQDLEPGPDNQLIRKLRRSDGVEFWGLVTVAAADLRSSSYHRIFQIANIDELKKTYDTLDYRESTWRSAIVDSHHAVWDYYARIDELHLSEEWKVLRGISPATEVSTCCSEWEKNVHPDDLGRVQEINSKQNCGKTEKFGYEYRERQPDGKWIWIYSCGQTVEWSEDGKPVRIVGIDVDVTDLKRKEEDRLLEIEQTYQRHLTELEAAHKETEAARKKASIISDQDVMTGLSNRRAFSRQLKQMAAGPLELEDGSDRAFFVLLIDLDHFKPINDTYGHSVGDMVICETANRLQATIGENAMVARLGGDEFGIILGNVDSKADENTSEAIADRLIEAIQKPIHQGNLRVEVSASIGIARYPECGTSESALLRRADIAMYHAKLRRTTGVALFTPAMEQRVVSRARLEVDVREAVRCEDFEPYFQPVIDLATGELSGFEVLARWVSPDRWDVGPSEFIPIIEQFSLMSPFGASMLRQTILANRNFGSDCRINMNLSAKGICDVTTARNIIEILVESDFPLEKLQFEVSELALLEDMNVASDVMGMMRDHGITFALDDFGVGYSSLSYLRTLSFETLKLDRSFVASVDTCSDSEKIVHSVLALASQFGMKTVAEGIESEAVLQKVTDMGFSHGQGFLFGKAVPAKQAQAMITGKPVSGQLAS